MGGDKICAIDCSDFVIPQNHSLLWCLPAFRVTRLVTGARTMLLPTERLFAEGEASPGLGPTLGALRL
jgi:hypothetical protein